VSKRKGRVKWWPVLDERKKRSGLFCVKWGRIHLKNGEPQLRSAL